jgi:hypothetical protein
MFSVDKSEALGVLPQIPSGASPKDTQSTPARADGHVMTDTAHPVTSNDLGTRCGSGGSVLSVDIGGDTPLRLDVAAKLAFPDGSMTAAGLRKEAGRGRLIIERIARKDYTTLSAIARMRELCRLPPRVHGCGSEKPNAIEQRKSRTTRYGLSATEAIKRAHDAALATVEKLSKPSPTTSPESTSPRRRKGSVIPLGSRSQT